MTQGHIPDEYRQSVIRLFTVKREPNQYQPWELGFQQHSGGSACVIDGYRLLTNAHVVANYVYIQALKPDDTEKYSARVLYVDHDRELAILTVDDVRFFEGTKPVVIGDIPAQNEVVAVV